MIEIQQSAQNYFLQLIKQQEMEGLALRLHVKAAGTASADCQLSFCEPGESNVTDLRQEFEGFTLFVDKESIPFLEQSSFDYRTSDTGGELVIKAPKIRGDVPDGDSSLEARVEYLLQTEINPQLASHGGQVSLVEISADSVAVLRFGGGCQGCGMIDMTLKGGIEKSMLEKIPEIKGVVDVTDHDQGENPYFK